MERRHPGHATIQSARRLQPVKRRERATPAIMDNTLNTQVTRSTKRLQDTQVNSMDGAVIPVCLAQCACTWLMYLEREAAMPTGSTI
jgi:hypothetical protein